MFFRERYIVMFMGGIGNQLFQYAYLKYLEKNENKHVEAYFYNRVDPYKRQPIIDIIDPKINLDKKLFLNPQNNMIVRIITRPNNIWTKIAVWILCNMSIKYRQLELNEETKMGAKGDKNTYYSSGYTKYFKKLDYKGVTILKGYWQSAEMVNSVKNHIKVELPISYPEYPEYEKIEKLIVSPKTRAIAIHLRLIDEKYLGRQTQFMLPQSYYRRSIKHITSRRNKRLLFFVFSDDPTKVKNYMKDVLPTDKYLVVPNYNEIGGDLASMLLMSKCKDFILSNSTFAWWGAWINWSKKSDKKEDSIYCMPDKWDKLDHRGENSKQLMFSSDCVILKSS